MRCLAVAALLSAACSAGGGGHLSNPPPAPTGPSPVPPGPRTNTPVGVGVFSTPKECGAISVAASPLSRLTTIEYQSLVTDLLGGSAPPAALQVSNTKVGAFDQNFELVLSETSAGQYLSAAEALAENVVTNWAARSGCANFEEVACSESYVQGLAMRAFRGAVTAADKERLSSLVRAGADLSAQARVQVAVQAVLLSPKFLFTVPAATEVGVAGVSPTASTTPLSPTELAGRLSLALWKSAPDDALLSAAAQASTEANVENLARGMLKDARASRMFSDFSSQWLGVENLDNLRKAADLFPDFAAIQPYLGKEYQGYYAGLVNAGGTLSSLLNVPFTFSDPTLAKAYATDAHGVRLGILAQPGFLSQHAHPEKPSPVKRGLMLRERLLCDPVAPPPPGVQTEVIVGADSSPSAAFAAHSKDPVCAGCHQFLDGLGQGFNQFDAIGRYLPNEAASGVVVAPRTAPAADISGPFADLPELTAKLAQSEHVAQCYTLEIARYLMRRPEQEDDACALKHVYERFKTRNYELSEAVALVASSELFRFRRLHAGGTP
ncbi:MAG: DUF1592 domain-containing protein [Polyangiaceae bacterium]|nr:DUF1592 domain-containing protein [Polyangiaceae bacterium]